jgi:hypothetical protein
MHARQLFESESAEQGLVKAMLFLDKSDGFVNVQNSGDSNDSGVTTSFAGYIMRFSVVDAPVQDAFVIGASRICSDFSFLIQFKCRRPVTTSFAIGIDYGTNSVRALVVDVATGAKVAAEVYNYRRGDAEFCSIGAIRFWRGRARQITSTVFLLRSPARCGRRGTSAG